LKLRILRNLVPSVLIGVGVGITSTAFLFALHAVTELRLTHPKLIIGLPLAGLLTGAISIYCGPSVTLGIRRIVDEIHAPATRIPLIMAPYIFLTTLLTHGFGGSAGREGSVVQIGATVSESVSQWLRVHPEDRRRLLMAGAAAGFGAGIGAPLAGAIFGIEFWNTRWNSWRGLLETTLASAVATTVARYMHAPHTRWISGAICPPLSWRLCLTMIGLGVLFGVLARTYCGVENIFHQVMSRLPYSPIVTPFIGGSLISLVVVGMRWQIYSGLGIDSINHALSHSSHWTTPFIKLLITALTVASGFKGGEFIPLVFMGSSLGSALGPYMGLSIGIGAVMGFGSVFGAASQTPIASAVMVAELFGAEWLGYGLLVGVVAAWAAGKKGIYYPSR